VCLQALAKVWARRPALWLRSRGRPQGNIDSLACEARGGVAKVKHDGNALVHWGPDGGGINVVQCDVVADSSLIATLF